MRLDLEQLLWPTKRLKRILIRFENVKDKTFILETLNTSWKDFMFEEAQPGKPYDIMISMAQPDEMPTGFEGFSVYIPPERILFNSQNWRLLPTGYTHNRTSEEATLENYRKHLINHEVAHFLGFGHGECDITEQPTVESPCRNPPKFSDIPEISVNFMKYE